MALTMPSTKATIKAVINESTSKPGKYRAIAKMARAEINQLASFSIIDLKYNTNLQKLENQLKLKRFRKKWLVF